MIDSKCLLTAIRRSNDERLEWCRGGPARIVGLLSENLDYWKNLGVDDSDSLDMFLIKQEAKLKIDDDEDIDIYLEEPDLDYDALP